MFNATPLDRLIGWGRQAVENSAPCSGPNTQFGALPMQLADHVERKGNGQSATETPPPRIPSFAAVTRLALPCRFHQRRLAFVRVYPSDRPRRILNSPSNDAEYLLPTAIVSN
jgi:hypothetical protein